MEKADVCLGSGRADHPRSRNEYCGVLACRCAGIIRWFCFPGGRDFSGIGKNPGKEVPKWLAEIGRRDAFFIYLFHLAIADMWMDLVWYLGIETGSVYQWTRPFAVCILTTFGAVLMGKIRNLRKGSSL